MRPQARKFGGMFKKRMNEGGAAKTAPMKSTPTPEPRPSNLQDVKDERLRRLEEKAPTTKTEMGKRFAKGGRVRRYAEGGEADDATMEQSLTDSKSFGEAFRAARSGGDKTFTYRGKQYNTEMRSDKPTASKASTSTATSRTAEVKDTSEAKPVPSGETNAGAKTGRVSSLAKGAPSDEQKEENASRLGEIGMGVMSAIPAVGALRGMTAARGLRTAAQEGVKRLSGPAEMGRLTGPAEMGRLTGPAEVKRLSAPMDRMAKARAAKYTKAREWARKEAEHDARRSSDMEAGFRKGGKVKESKAMVKKEVEFFKKKGAPKSMIKHEEAEAKKYARGGGIESRGRTKGTVIKMASGGSVSARADGCVQRGKTKGRMV